MFLAVQLDKKLRFNTVYQTAFFLPVVMPVAVIGFVWQLVCNPDTGLINSPIGADNPSLKGVDPSLREASELDGANEWQTFKKVIFPTPRPTNTIVVVVTVIEALSVFDLVFVVNKVAQGTEPLMSL